MLFRSIVGEGEFWASVRAKVSMADPSKPEASLLASERSAIIFCSEPDSISVFCSDKLLIVSAAFRGGSEETSRDSGKSPSNGEGQTSGFKLSSLLEICCDSPDKMGVSPALLRVLTWRKAVGAGVSGNGMEDGSRATAVSTPFGT